MSDVAVRQALVVAIPEQRALSAIHVDYSPDGWSLVDRHGEILTFDRPGANYPSVSADVNWICFYRETDKGREILSLIDMNTFSLSDFDYWPFGEPKQEKTPTTAVNTRGSRLLPVVNPLVQTALDALDAKRVEGWRPAGRDFGWGEKPGARDCFGKTIDLTPITLADLDIPEDEKARLRYAMTDVEHIRAWFGANEVAAGTNPFAGKTMSDGGTMTNTRGSVAAASPYHPAGAIRREGGDSPAPGSGLAERPADTPPDRKTNRWSTYFPWFNEKCEWHGVSDLGDDRNVVRREVVRRLVPDAATCSFTEIPPDVPVERVKQVTESVLNERYPVRKKASHKMTEAEIRQKYMTRLKHHNKRTNVTTYTDYLKVDGRILLFRLQHPLGAISTEIVTSNEQGVLVKAIVLTADNKLLATAHAFATYAGSEHFSGRVYEKAEKMAIGRALAHAGFGTDAAGEADDDDDEPGEEAPTSDITAEEAGEWVNKQRRLGIQDSEMIEALGVEALTLLNFQRKYLHMAHLTAAFDKWLEDNLGKQKGKEADKPPATEKQPEAAMA